MQPVRSYEAFTRKYLQRIGGAVLALIREVEEVAKKIWKYPEGLLEDLPEEQQFEAAVKKIEDKVAAVVAGQEMLNTCSQRSSLTETWRFW
jgi:hypothetical protein